MYEITNEQLEKLKCSECQGYLSTSPVMLKVLGDNICGKCAILSDNSCVRNKVYEELAKNALFPCQYHEKGCLDKICFDEIKYHELGCDFRHYVCPLNALKTCSWSDNLANLKQHFEEKHQKLIVDNPYFFKPNIRAEYEKWVLMQVQKFLFLIQVKCNVYSAKLWFCVRFLGNPKYAELFDFIVSISNDDVDYKQRKEVQSFEMLLLSRYKVVEININSMLSLVHDYQNTHFVITVQLKNEYCSMCLQLQNVSNDIQLISTGYICFDCNNKIKCKNYYKGCRYEDIKMNMVKHELWLCQFSEKICFINDCNNNISIHKNLLQHFHENHCKNNTIESNTVISKDIVLNRTCCGLIIVYDSIFVRDFICDGDKLYYKILSNLSKHETKKYTCILKVFNIKTGFALQREMKRDLHSLDYDWIIEIVDDKRNSFIRKKNKLNSEQLSNTKVYSCEMKIEKCN